MEVMFKAADLVGDVLPPLEGLVAGGGLGAV
jgi:hypothetical protein